MIPEFRGHMDPLRASYDTAVAKKRDYGAPAMAAIRKAYEDAGQHIFKDLTPPTCVRHKRGRDQWPRHALRAHAYRLPTPTHFTKSASTRANGPQSRLFDGRSGARAAEHGRRPLRSGAFGPIRSPAGARG
ncbi:hypothetical protein MMAN_13170 [Mycobacterium mantenii]|uniref:Uncharacterized protein n=1 Tax=Mycobacterium mantenii TaxID=560555 RepID=A0ABN6A6A2_MYCNT|nr:hypothetical protein MMAN_13170 [Mycobacterium mantenii]